MKTMINAGIDICLIDFLIGFERRFIGGPSLINSGI